MPREYILPLTRYDNPNELPIWIYIPEWFYHGYIVCTDITPKSVEYVIRVFHTPFLQQ